MGWFRCTGGNGGGGPTRTPSIIAGYSKNMNTVGTLSQTFESAGKFQYVVFKRHGESPITADPVIKLNDETLTPNRTSYQSEGQVFYYNDVTVQSGDILSVSHSETAVYSGLQLFILKNADISLFEVIGLTYNNSQSFALPNDQWIFQIYRCGYYNSNNNFSYRLERHSVIDDSTDVNYQTSIPTPAGDGRYYYGFTCAVII